MALSRRYYNANSILESVIALTIISVCLYVAIMVYASVFSPKASAAFYIARNKTGSQFFLLQLDSDMVPQDGITISETWINTHLKQVEIQVKDQLGKNDKRNFYIHGE